MDMIAAKRTPRVRSVLTNLFATDLLAYILLIFIIYTLYITGAVFFLDWVFGGEHDPKWMRAVDVISFIISLLYVQWIRESQEGYAVLPMLYRRIHSKMLTFTDKYAAFHAHITNTKDADSINSFNDVHDALIAVGTSTFYMFSSGEDHDRDDELDNIDSPAVKDIVYAYRGIMPTPINMVRDLLSVIMLSVNQAKVSSNIGSGQLNCLITDISELYKILEDIDTNMNAPTPTMFKTHAKMVLYFYFGIWLPYSLWVYFDIIATIIIYPILMFLLTGMIFYRWWLGDPFDPSRPVKLVDYEDWKNEYARRVHTYFSTGGHNPYDNK
jgi:hypothetical protein